MKKIHMLSKISIQYWRHHKKRFFAFLIILILGVSALCSTALLIRSEKEAVLEEELKILGNYDLIVYDTTDTITDKIAASASISDIGKLYNLGYVESSNGARSYAAAFADSSSEDMYHMTCTRGYYPENTDQIALDISVAKMLGIKPYPGERVMLRLYSNDGECLIEKEYSVSGLFEATSQIAYGGWYRYPTTMSIGSYNMPGVFFYKEQNNIFNSNSTTFFVQSDSSDLNALSETIIELSDNNINWDQISTPNGRRFAYSYVLGISTTIQDKYGDNSLSSIIQAMKNGDVIKDFYSGVLMPVVSVIIFIIVILSIMSITRNIIRDKRDNYAILSCLGLEKKQLKAYIFCDFTIVTVICTVVGLVLGFVIHIGMIMLLNKANELNLQYGFFCSKYVSTVTYDPIFLPAVIIVLCVEAAIFISLIGLSDKTPIQMFSDMEINDKSKKRGLEPVCSSWKKLLANKINLHNRSIAVVSILVMSSALFGYTYFHALSDKNNVELEFEKEEYGLDEWDYKAERSQQNQMYEFNIENHHDYGISREAYKQLEEQTFVKNIFGKMENRSTRIVFERELTKEEDSALREFNLRKYEYANPENELVFALHEAEEAMINKIGYSETEHIYSLPTIGYFNDDLEKFSEYVVDGKINLAKIDSGEEALVVMTKYGYDKFSGLFNIGDDLSLSDIMLDNTEDMFDFGSFLPSEHLDPVYKKTVTIPEGTEVDLTSYAIGKRKDIDVKVGAIIVLDIPEAKKYMIQASSSDYGINVFCSFDTFESWGLSDCNLTTLCMELTDDSLINMADKYWYSMMADVKGITSHSTAEVTANINRGTKKIMSIYYCMIIILTLIATITIAINLYTDIRMRSNKFAILRACGMSIGQIIYLLFRQNIFYPIIGILFSIVPVALCQKFFEIVRSKLESGAWTSDTVPWIRDVPYGYN